MGRRDFSAGHPRVGQWVWIDEPKDYARLGVVQGPRAADPTLKVTREGRVTRVESTAVLGGRRRALELALAAPPDAVTVALVDPRTGGQSGAAHAEIEVDRLTPVVRLADIPLRRRRLMQPGWAPRP